jgi:hypothetical protein
MYPHNRSTSGTMRLHASGRRKTLKDSKVKVYQDEPPYGLVTIYDSLDE